MNLGDFIKEVCKNNGLITTLNKIEPSLSMLMPLSDIFDVTIDALAGRRENE